MFKMCLKILVLKNNIFVWKIQILGCKNTILGFSKLTGLVKSLIILSLALWDVVIPWIYKMDTLIVGSGVRPPPFLFYPHPFYKGTLDTENSGPHPFSNLYVSYIHFSCFWYHGNVVDWHPVALLIYHFTYFQPEDIPIFSILFCKYKCTTWKSEEPHPL